MKPMDLPPFFEPVFPSITMEKRKGIIYAFYGQPPVFGIENRHKNYVWS
jgi:hypothetical protein